MDKIFVECLVVTVCLLMGLSRGDQSRPCNGYDCGYRPRTGPFVPAPPQQTPRCAKAGQTYCEMPDDYPAGLIKFLAETGSFDLGSLFIDESKDDFNALRSKPTFHDGQNNPRQGGPQFYPQASPGTTPTSLPQHSVQRGQPSIVYEPPFRDTYHEGYNYDPPRRSQPNPITSGSRSPIVHNSQQNFYNPYSPGIVDNRKTDPFYQRHGQPSNRYFTPSRRSGSSNRPVHSFGRDPFTDFIESKKFRQKRQASSPDSMPLCRTNSQFIVPRAALNSDGSWKFVVNMPEEPENYSQLVQTEICASTTCDGLCSVPDGYTSRCEQKYVQKRLVGLDESGGKIYTDVFWFPHGCLCQIAPIS